MTEPCPHCDDAGWIGPDDDETICPACGHIRFPGWCHRCKRYRDDIGRMSQRCEPCDEAVKTVLHILYIEELQRTIIDAANHLCPAIEGNTEDLAGDLDAGYRILRTAVEDINPL